MKYHVISGETCCSLVHYTGSIPYIGKFSRYKIFKDGLVAIIDNNGTSDFPVVKFRGCKQIRENSEIILLRKFPNSYTVCMKKKKIIFDS